MTKCITGLIDVMYQKVISVSNQAHMGAATGSIANLLFADTMKIAIFIQYLQLLFQMPTDIVAYLVYLGAQINPIALSGLLILLILVPIISISMSKIVLFQKKIMTFRDMRIQRSTEVLNGISVIKFFCLENIQHARLQGVRDKELQVQFRQSMIFSVISVVQNALAPLMTSLSFISLMYTKTFDVISAFTIMFLY